MLHQVPKQIEFACKAYFGGGNMQKPPAPPPPPSNDAAANAARSKNIARNKSGRASTILGGATMGSSNGASTVTKTLLGG
jgi:hypothetical protein